MARLSTQQLLPNNHSFETTIKERYGKIGDWRPEIFPEILEIFPEYFRNIAEEAAGPEIFPEILEMFPNISGKINEPSISAR